MAIAAIAERFMMFSYGCSSPAFPNENGPWDEFRRKGR
jgi:hypothetical protein